MSPDDPGSVEFGVRQAGQSHSGDARSEHLQSIRNNPNHAYTGDPASTLDEAMHASASSVSTTRLGKGGG